MNDNISHVYFLTDSSDGGHPQMSVVWGGGSALLSVEREDTGEFGMVEGEVNEPEPDGESFPLVGAVEAAFLNLSAEAKSATAEGPSADRTAMLVFLDVLEKCPEDVDGAGVELVRAAVAWYRAWLGAGR